MEPSKTKCNQSTPGFSQRERINRLLSDAVASPVVTLSAGSGHGKTQAVSSFLSTTTAKVIWLQLTRLDNYSIHFWEAFTNALAAWNYGLATQLKREQFPDSLPAFHQFLKYFTKAAYDEQQVIFVFDDYHLLENGLVFKFIDNLICARLENTSVILLSKNDIKVNVPGEGDNSQVVRLTGRQLRFTLEETAAYYAALGISLNAAQLHDIYEYTEGWAFAVHLFGMHIRKYGLQDGDLLGDMVPHLYQLLDEQAFCNYPQEVQLLLVSLSLLDSFTSEIAMRLSGIGPQKLLELLGRHPYLRFQPQSSSYSFHNIYQQFLEQKQVLLTPGQRESIFREAAGWYEEREQYLEAAEYYHSCGDSEKMYRMVWLVSTYRLSPETATRLLELLELLPGQFVLEHPMVRVKQASLRFNCMEFEEASRLLLETKQQLEGGLLTGESKTALGEIHTMLGLYLLTQNQVGFVEHFKLGSQYLQGKSSLMSGRDTYLGNSNAIDIVGGRPGALQKMLDAIYEGMPYASIVLGGYGHGLEELAAAETSFYTGDLKNAERHAFQAIAKSRSLEQYDIVCNSYYLLMRIAFAGGNCREIMGYIEKLTEYGSRRNGIPYSTIPDIAISWFYVKIGKLEKVAPWLQNDVMEYKFFPPMGAGKDRVVKAAYLLAQRKYYELLAFIEESFPLSETKGQTFILMKLRLTRAVVYDLLGETGCAARELEEAYRFAEGNGIVTIFSEFGKQMRSLTSHVRKETGHSIPLDWLDMIHTKATTYAKYAAAVQRQYQELYEDSPSPLENLTPREDTVLQLICEGLTQEEIAGHTGLSPSTVKGVVKRIYQKLGALNRADAVRIAMGAAMKNGDLPIA